LKMKYHCETCRAPLALDSEAYVCSFECTYCASCTIRTGGQCPKCSGELVRRPRRTVTVLKVSGAIERRWWMQWLARLGLRRDAP
jgi:hypothetical protein